MKKILLIIIITLIITISGCNANVSKTNVSNTANNVSNTVNNNNNNEYVFVKSIKYDGIELKSEINYVINLILIWSGDYVEGYNEINELSHDMTNKQEIIAAYQNEIGHYRYQKNNNSYYKAVVQYYRYEYYCVKFYNNCEYFILKTEKYNSLTDELTVEYSLIRPNSYEISLVSDF